MSTPDTDTPDADALVERILRATDDEEKRQIYAEWADCYDDDLDDSGYVAPGIAVDLLEHHERGRAKSVYDAGCGTGRVGRVLTRRGYSHVVGGDFSEEMLEQARESGVYAELRRDDYGEPLDLPDASFGAVIAVGVYGEGFRERFLDEMVRILAPGGILVFTALQGYWSSEVEDDIESLIRARAVEVLSAERKPYALGSASTAWYACLRRRRPA